METSDKSKTVATVLGDRIVGRDDFRRIFSEAEQTVAERFLDQTSWKYISEAHVKDLLRYADVLSYSEDLRHRELSYVIVSLLLEAGSESLKEEIIPVAEAVFINLGNFPGISGLAKAGDSKYVLPASNQARRLAKEIIQLSSSKRAVLTDPQYQIRKSLATVNFFSFSGPTSLGKSFIIKDFLFDLVQQPGLDDQCIIVLVPTKALISQTAADLRALLLEFPDVHVATFPVIPAVLRARFKRSILVLTPERLLRYLSNPERGISYLIVDEAQKIISAKDARSSLYYHAINELLRRYAARLLFSSPSIDNPEIFLKLFGKSADGALAIDERSVAQTRYFVDLVRNRQFLYPYLDDGETELATKPNESDAYSYIIRLSAGDKSIIYVNSSLRAADFAMELAERLPYTGDEKLASSSRRVGEVVHSDYYLAETLKKGVAFHHGKMPQEVRQQVEHDFADPTSGLQFVVCTSTLLEGVNLPAKNIFVLDDAQGLSDFQKLDFENLIGRAGRLSYDFSGNIIVLRAQPNKWKKGEPAILRRAKPEKAKSFLVDPPKRQRKDYNHIAAVLRGEKVPNTPSAERLRNLRQYASVLMINHVDKSPTMLSTNFLEKVKDSKELLDRSTKSLQVPIGVLRRAPSINPEYQNEVWLGLLLGELQPLMGGATSSLEWSDCLDILKTLSRVYNWPEEESIGHDPLLPKGKNPTRIEGRLSYWAILMSNWLSGKSTSEMIANALWYRQRTGIIRYLTYEPSRRWVQEDFDRKSARHVNIVIEETLKDLEGGLRFRIMEYLQNYYDICIALLGENRDILNLPQMMEYGSSDKRLIGIQELGLSRESSLEILDKAVSYFSFDESGRLTDVDDVGLVSSSDLSEEVRVEVGLLFHRESA